MQALGSEVRIQKTIMVERCRQKEKLQGRDQGHHQAHKDDGEMRAARRRLWVGTLLLGYRILCQHLRPIQSLQAPELLPLTTATILRAFDFSQAPEHLDIHAPPHVFSPPYDAHPFFQSYTPMPYEVDVRTESQMYVNDVPTRKDSSTSTFSTWHAPPEMTPFLEDEWVHEGIFEPAEMFSEDGPEAIRLLQQPDATVHSPNSRSFRKNPAIHVEACDKSLLDHFLQKRRAASFPHFGDESTRLCEI